MPNYREDILDIELSSGSVNRTLMNKSIGAGDSMANRFGVRAFRDGVAEDLSGNCMGLFIRRTGDTVVINDGVVEGNVAYVTLPDSCYAVDGNFVLAIKLVSSGESITLRIVDGTVNRTSTVDIVDPGTIMPTIEELLIEIAEAVESIPQDYSALSDSVTSLENAIVNKSLANGTDLNTVLDIGYYRLGLTNTYSHQPVSGGRRLLIVNSLQLEGGAPYQVLIQFDTGKIFTRMSHDGEFDAWANYPSSLVEQYLFSQSLENGTDLDDVKTFGFYRLGSGSTYAHQPISGGRRMLMVYPMNESGGAPYQMLVQFDTGYIYTRMYHDGDFDNWVECSGDNTARKIALGANPYRKTEDHGGFYTVVSGVNVYQNSPLAFLKSAREGVMFHNLDIVFSSDGVPFVVHDDNLTDINGVSFKVSTTTAANVKTHTLGDQEYSWIPQTLAEADEYIKSLGGIVDMIDVSGYPSSSVISASSLTAGLVDYYRKYKIHATWTNWDSETYRNAFITAGSEFGVYMVSGFSSDSVNANKTLLDNIIAYIRQHPNTKFAVNCAASASLFRQAIEGNDGGSPSKPYIQVFSELGVTLFVYTFNASNYTNTPAWADGIVSENINVNYMLWNRAVNG